MQPVRKLHYCMLHMALAATLGAAGVAAADREALSVSVRRDGLAPYVPYASYQITIKVPEAKLLEGWRCCWIEAFSRPVAAALSQQEQKPVAGNDPGVRLDAVRTEASVREVAPGLFRGRLWLSADQGWGNHTARIYVHLYQTAYSADNAPDESPERYRTLDRQGHRIASDFLMDPYISVNFMYPPHPIPLPNLPGETVPGAPPSQLPNY